MTQPHDANSPSSRTQNRSPAPQPQPEKKKSKKKSKKKKGTPFFLQRLRRQDIVLLTGLLSLACFSLIVVGFLILRFQPATAGPVLTPAVTPGPQPTHTVTYVQVTGLNQYELAKARALAWAPDAQLVSANTHWPGVISLEQVGAPGEWSYQFYSPGKERLFIARVAPDGTVEAIEHVVKITLPPPLLGTGNWVVDSPAALAIWLDHGGAELVRRNPGLEVLIQLRYLNNHPNPVWMVIGTDQRTQDIHTVVIDTAEGTVLSKRSTLEQG